MGDTATCNRRKLRNAGRKVRPEMESIGGTLRLSLRNNDVFSFGFFRSATSPGTTKGTKTTMSSTRARALPSAATSVIVIFSNIGNSFLFSGHIR